MKLALSILLTIVCGTAFGQIYFDPAVSGAQAANSAIIDRQLNITNEKLTLIERSQLAVTGNLAVVNSMQEKIYKGLSEVSSILTTLSNVKEIARIAAGISSDIEDIMKLANENPAFLIFAEHNATLFQQRATALAFEVNNFALKGGTENLMDAGERSKIVNTILNELVILRSYTYGMYRSMYFARLKGFLKSVNPFQEYIEMDVAIVDDIVKNRETLK